MRGGGRVSMSVSGYSDEAGGEVCEGNIVKDLSREERISRVLIPLSYGAAIALLLWVHFSDPSKAIPVHSHGADDPLTTQSSHRELQTIGDPAIQDYQALMSLRTALQTANPTPPPLLGSWESGNTSTSPCLWPGITCNLVAGLTRVTALDLSNSGFSGSIPLALTNLSALVSLSLENNNFNGSIPSEIGNLSSLTSLDLSGNALSGPISTSYGGLNNLKFLNLAQNKLTGGIPAELLSNCANLQLLNISSNMFFRGVLPAGWKNCQNLTHLDLSNADMVGWISPELGELPNLQYLSLAENNFTGEISSAVFANCGNLRYVDLSVNQLVGPIPPEVGNCSKLTVAIFSQNNLTSIPPEFSQLTELNWLFLGQNQFGGQIPAQFSRLINLVILDLKSCSLAGPIPSFLSQLKALQYLFLQRNFFTGSIPAGFSVLPNLVYLDLSDNLLTGNIPSTVGNLSAATMQFLFLAGNNFTGRIPSEVGKLLSLQILDIGENQLSGSIPSSIFNLRKLLWLRLADNYLSGTIPDELSNTTSLMWLNLLDNQLSGPLPDNLSSISTTAPQTFQENINNLLYLPKQLGDSDTVVRWLPRDGFPYSSVPGVLTRDNSQSFWNFLMRGTNVNPLCQYINVFSGNGYFQVSNNQLSGSLPPSLGDIPNYIAFYMSNNSFSGEIPPVFNKQEMNVLELNDNSFTGAIPENLDMVKCAYILRLDSNNLTGAIPASLQQCLQLALFNVSYNPLLSGPVPSENQFATFGISSYLGDDLLCSRSFSAKGDENNSLPLCKDAAPPPGGHLGSQFPPAKGSKLGAATIVGIILASSLGSLVLCLAGFFLIGRAAPAKSKSDEFSDDGKNSHRFADTSVHVSLFSVELPKQLTYTDLLMATNNFDEGNVVGSGGFGVVYRAKLTDGSLVAIKKLIQEGPQADREFLAEMETLGHVHHDNLVPLLGCSTFGSEKLLVYRFMANGSLDDWLHERPNGAQALGWPLRLNIALGMAKGLKFLHHSCSPPIIHRDMKASNILLDENFDPRLTDFGLARVLGSQETHVSTIVAGTLGYVPPEYCQTWRATIKGDVYSYGVVLLELITGRRPMDASYNSRNCGNIVEWVIALVKDGSQTEAYDPNAVTSGSPVELLQFLKLATWCTEELPIKRPTMREVLKALEEIQGGNYLISKAKTQT